MELLCTTASVKSRIHFACNLRTAMSQLLLVFLPLDCGACLFKAPPVCYRHVEFADTQDPLKFSPAQDPAIEHQKFRADKASDRKNALQEDKKRLMQECEVVEAEELAEYQRRCGLETEHQELKREMLGLCEELASANHLAEATLEEQLQRSQNALRDLEASTDASSRDQQIVGPSEATQSPLTYSSWRPSLPREFQADSPPGLHCMSPTFGTPER
eukprot:symbB.v1.2.021377.t2/scaffold1843.1/size100617/13